MSTLKVGTIQSTSAAHSSTPEQIARGRAKKWINFNAQDNSIRDDFGISSITDHSTGQFTLNFDGDMSNANYSVSAFCFRNGSGKVVAHIDTVSTYTTSAIRIMTSGGNNTGNLGLNVCEPLYVFIQIFGD